MTYRALTVCAVLALTIACSKPRVDGTNETTYATSLKRVTESLPDGPKRQKFQESVMIVGLSSLADQGLLGLAAKGPQGLTTEAMQKLNGKTADEIIAEADRITAERKAKEREQALAEIKELTEKKLKAESARAELAKFEVSRSRFYKRKSSFLSQPIIELTVKNGTAQAISHAYFVGTLTSPGRSVPWLKEEFNYEIRGGLEPGETATWQLAPNSFSAWGSVEQRPEMVLTVEVQKLDGASGETLYDSRFRDEDVKRLATLKREFGVN